MALLLLALLAAADNQSAVPQLMAAVLVIVLVGGQHRRRPANGGIDRAFACDQRASAALRNERVIDEICNNNKNAVQ